MTQWLETSLGLIVLAVVVPTLAAVFAYAFLFKAMAHMQQRLGPMEAGPHGSLQLVAEAIKWVQKEDLFPRRADRLVFGLAPIVAIVTAFSMCALIPVSNAVVGAAPSMGLFLFAALSGVSSLAIVMAGWGSNSKFSVLGGLRAAAQLLAYEIPLVLALLGVVVLAGSANLVSIVGAQSSSLWFVFPQIVGFTIFMIAAQAELTQAPFDVPVAESELVAGYMTEYSGFRFLMFFIAELATAAALSGLAVTCFLGGWNIPFVELTGTLGAVVGPLVFFVKLMIVGFLIFWIRFSFPRVREDQLHKLAWKVLVPLGLANVAITACLKVWM